MSMVFSMSRSSKYIFRLNAWSTHFWARAATSINAYGETENDVLYTSLMWCGISSMEEISPCSSIILVFTISHKFKFFNSVTKLWLISKYFPEILLRENTWANRGSMPGVVPATRPMLAFGATAIKVAFLITFV